MVDWMFEVIRAFKMSEQTFFLSVQYLDRFVCTISRKLDISELHLIGITCMFVASKYEDITPLYLKTMVKKVGHNKIQGKEILDLEKEICTTLKWRFSSVPTVLEFLESYSSNNRFKDHPDLGSIQILSKCLACL